MMDETGSGEIVFPQESEEEIKPITLTEEDKERNRRRRMVEQMRQSFAHQDLLEKVRPPLVQKQQQEAVLEFKNVVATGDFTPIYNRWLELKRMLHIDLKTRRLSSEAQKCAHTFLKFGEHMLQSKKNLDQLQSKLKEYQSEEKRKNLEPDELIEVRNLITKLRQHLRHYPTVRDKTLDVFDQLFRLRNRDLTEEASLKQSAEKYLQYVEGPQRAHLEIQMQQKMKDMPFEKRIEALKSFIETLMQVSPSLIRAEVGRRIELATDFFINQHYDEAIQELEQARTYLPDLEEIYSLLAKCWGQKGNREKEKENLQKALEIHPTDVKTLLALAEIHEEQEEYSKVIQYYQRVVKLEPERHALVSRLARLAFENKKWKTAIPYLLQILDRHPDSKKSLRRLGIALIRIGEYERGIAILRSLLQKNIHDAEIDLALGLAYRAKEIYSDAHRCFVSAHEANPEDEETMYWLAISFYERGEYSDAEPLCKNLKERNSENLAYELIYSKILRRLGKAEEALSFLQPHLEKIRKNKEWLFEYSQVCIDAHQAEKAYPILKKLIKEHPEDEDFRNTFSQACIHTKRFGEAMEFLKPTG